jgi:hypothetical protein
MTAGTTRRLTLAELSDDERNERFDRLQERMRGVWEIMGSCANFVVVVTRGEG